MVDVQVADEVRLDQWYAFYVERLKTWFEPRGAGRSVEFRQNGWANGAGHELLLLTEDGAEVGRAAVTLSAEDPDRVVIHDLWVDPPARGRGLGRAARAAAEQWARDHGARTVAASLWGDDAGVATLFADYPLNSQRMVKHLDPAAPPAGTGAAWTYRMMRRGAEYQQFVRSVMDGFAEQLVASGSATPDQAAGRAISSHEELLPQEFDTPGHGFYVIEADEEPVATIWICEFHPGTHFVNDVEVNPAFRGRGYGRAAMQVGEDRAAAAGSRHLALNVFGHNDVAIKLYESMGYEITDSTRSLRLTGR
jgi:GNAT superfamily N-acetyltransferase